MSALDFALPYPSSRSAVMGRNVVAASQPLAAQAGLRKLLQGGNAIDAAVAAAMAPAVAEPTGCGLGGDAFAIVWDGDKLCGLNSSGRSPAKWTRERFGTAAFMPERGLEAVTVSGAVAVWVRLLSGRTAAVEPAIGAAAIEALRAYGHEVLANGAGWEHGFDGAQLILRTGAGYIAGSGSGEGRAGCGVLKPVEPVTRACHPGNAAGIVRHR